MKILSVIGVFFLLLTYAGCSSSQQSQTDKTSGDSLYVFETVPDTGSGDIPVLNYPDLGATYYVVQIGAFTTKDRAEKFAEESKTDLPYNVKISFSKQNNLYVVQLKDYYTTRSEAEKVRDDLRQNEKFGDAWILTIYK
ncbi:MAG TPA: SPOR domain-containing protein [Ignavibacteriaceae bacterium]|nr:SPOR domain-containing protein [Ignavibacteriaceae bacterium]